MTDQYLQRRSLRIKSIATLLCGGILSVAHADSRQGADSIFTVTFENDLFGDTDQQYTNGLQVGWTSPDLKQFTQAEQVPLWLVRLAERLPFINDDESRSRNVGIRIGQQMFTPEDTQSTALVIDDRPYAGWLYGGVAFISKTERALDSFEIQVGVVGPWSLAEDAQKLVHSVRDLPEPQGWDNQLENEPGVVLIYEHRSRLIRADYARGFSYDLLGHWGGAGGNVLTELSAGAEFRLGWNLPFDYGTSLIRPGGEVSAPSALGSNDTPPDWGFHLFSGLTGRLKLRDIFLDGNSFRDSHSIDKEYWVGDFVVGASVSLRAWRLSYAQAFRTREFEGQDREHNFGSLTLSWTF